MFLFFHHNMVVGWNYNYPFWESTLFSFFLKWEIFHSPMVASTSGRLTMVWFNSRPLMVSVPVKSFSPFSLLSLSLSFLHASYEQQFLSFIILPCSVSKKWCAPTRRGHCERLRESTTEILNRPMSGFWALLLLYYNMVVLNVPHHTTLPIKVDLSEWIRKDCCTHFPL